MLRSGAVKIDAVDHDHIVDVVCGNVQSTDKLEFLVSLVSDLAVI